MLKNRIRLWVGALALFLLFLIVSPVTAQSFSPVFEWIKRFQKGEEIELRAHVDPNSFILFRGQASSIDQATFQRLLPKDTPPQQLEILCDEANKKLEGVIIKYEVNKQLHLEEEIHLDGDRPGARRKTEFIQINSYPLKYWLNFIWQAVSYGLTEYEVIEYEEESYASLSFRQIDPLTLQFGQLRMSFSNEFYEYMKFSVEFKPRKRNTNKLVIFVHEPHWLLAGQYQLIEGLKVLLEANSLYKFRFLVEGYWEEENKYIPTNPTLTRFSKDTSDITQVLSLLGNFLSDGPFAYRLLYNPELPALAIDDPEVIRMTPREPELKDAFEQQKAFMSIFSKLGKLPEEKITQPLVILTTIGYLTGADTRDLKGEAAIDFYSQISELYDGLSNQLSFLDTQDFIEECSFLKTQAKSFRTQTEIYDKALKRDATMARNIVSHFESEYGERIPLVFIGNFHTPGIIDRLPEDISYIVIEPRISPLLVAPPKKDRDKFNQTLRPSERANYIKMLGGILKVAVAPLERELPYYGSFLRTESSRIKSRKETFLASCPFPPDVSLKIYETIARNGIFSNAQAGFAGEGAILPPSFKGAFASFSFGPGGENPKVVLYDRDRDNWQRSDRLNYLRNVLLIPPYEKLRKETRKVSFFQDKETHLMFMSIFDPITQIFYLFEAKKETDIDKALILPKLKDKEEIHLKLSLLKLLHHEEEEAHG